MHFRRLMILLTLVAWVLLHPIAMTFGGCAGMWMTCDSPCALTSCALPTPMPPVTPQVAAYLALEPAAYLPQPVLKRFKPPPKPILCLSLFPAIA